MRNLRIMTTSVDIMANGEPEKREICGILIVVLHSAGVTDCFSWSEIELSLDVMCHSLALFPNLPLSTSFVIIVRMMLMGVLCCMVMIYPCSVFGAFLDVPSSGGIQTCRVVCKAAIAVYSPST